MEVLKRHLLGPRVGGSGDNFFFFFFLPWAPTLHLYGLKLGDFVFDFSTEDICIRQSIKWCWWGALFFGAGREVTETQALFPASVSPTKCTENSFSKGIFFIIGGFLITLFIFAYLYHVIFFLIAFIAGRSLLNEICTTLFQTTHVLLFGNI